LLKLTGPIPPRNMTKLDLMEKSLKLRWEKPLDHSNPNGKIGKTGLLVPYNAVEELKLCIENVFWDLLLMLLLALENPLSPNPVTKNPVLLQKKVEKKNKKNFH